MTETLWVLVAGVVVGALNAVGGGGTFIALPVLVQAGLPPVTANASATIALVPGAAAGAWVYRREIAPEGGVSVPRLAAVSAGGGLAGAALLLVLPARSFDAAVPWLLAFATLLLLSRDRLAAWAAGAAAGPVRWGPRAVLVGQFLLAVYGGYFGGAVGIMMLALWGAGLGLDPAAGNPMRIVLVAAVYLSSASVFLVASDALSSPLPLGAMLAGAVAGGFGGAHLARRLPARVLRGVIASTAVAMTAVYFAHG
ncbi:sulfite exporter TauE/SafE family protein [Streptomyces nodosus]|uniref:sulfite exporter TauE/SafE family protein n=1 Tax=Streptomyces nodosus TaxID=40318 RepID=UPI003454C02A